MLDRDAGDKETRRALRQALEETSRPEKIAVRSIVAGSSGARGDGTLLRGAWAAYAACAWAFLFAAPSFYWAAGGTVGMGTLDPGIATMARDPWFVALVWATGVAKVLAGLLALALVRPWGRRVPRWVLLAAAWGGGVLLVLHGGDFVVRGALALGGLVDVPAPAPWTAIRWYTFLWGPWFVVGGLLFCIAAWKNPKGSAVARPSARASLRHPRGKGDPD